MGFFAKLFGRKKKVKTQEDYLIEPVLKKEEKAVVEEAPAPVKKEVSKPTATKKSPAKKAQPTKEQKQKEAPLPIEETVTKQTAKTGFFEIKKSKDDRYVFNLYASNKVIVATSQVYSSASSAINGIKSVKVNAEIAAIEDQTLKNYTPVPFPKWEIYLDKGGYYRFRLSASNGSCVCHSQGYTNKANCKNGIQSIIRTAKTAEIDKAYLTK